MVFVKVFGEVFADASIYIYNIHINKYIQIYEYNAKSLAADALPPAIWKRNNLKKARSEKGKLEE